MSPDDRASVIYLALLLIFIAGGYVISQRGQMNKSLQQAAIWGLIFCAVMAGYGLRDVVVQALFPSRGIVQGEEIIFRKANDGHFYVTLELNGTDIEFVLDTGASQIVLTPTDAARVGIDLDRLNFITPVMTASGQAFTAQAQIDRIVLGPIVDRNVPVAVNETEIFESLLGMTYLSRFGEIRIRGDRLFITR